MQLIDIGINLTHDSYDPDRDAVVQRALAAGVCHMLVTGASVEGSRAAIELSRKWPGLLRATAGCHNKRRNGREQQQPQPRYAIHTGGW